MKQIIQNNDSGLVSRTKINDNFTEVYDNDVTSQNIDGVVVLKGSYTNPTEGDVIIRETTDGAATFKYIGGQWVLKTSLATSVTTDKYNIYTEKAEGVSVKKVNLQDPNASELPEPSYNLIRPGFSDNLIVVGDSRQDLEFGCKSIKSFSDTGIVLGIAPNGTPDYSQTSVGRTFEFYVTTGSLGIRTEHVSYAILENHKFIIQVYNNSTGRLLYESFPENEFNSGAKGLIYTANNGNPVDVLLFTDIFLLANTSHRIVYKADRDVTVKGKVISTVFVPNLIFNGPAYRLYDVDRTVEYNPSIPSIEGDRVINNGTSFICVNNTTGSVSSQEAFNRFKFVNQSKLADEQAKGQLFKRTGEFDFDFDVIHAEPDKSGVIVGDISKKSYLTGSALKSLSNVSLYNITDYHGSDTLIGTSFNITISPTVDFLMNRAEYFAHLTHESTITITRNSDNVILHTAKHTYPPEDSITGIFFTTLPAFLMRVGETYNLNITTNVDGGIIGDIATGLMKFRVEGFRFKESNLLSIDSWKETTYTIGEFVINNGILYICKEAGSQFTDFQTNLTLGKWENLGTKISSSVATSYLESYTKSFTQAEKDKLNSLTGGRYLGVFLTLANLQSAHPTANVGDTATVTTPNGNMYYWKVPPGGWEDSGTGHLGDMLKSMYDPNSKNADAFSMANMVETSTKKIFTDSERTKLSDISSGAEQNVQSDWSQTDNLRDDFIKNKPNLSDLHSHSNKSTLDSITGTNTGNVTLGGVSGDTTDDTLDLSGQVLTVNAVTQSTDGAMIASDKLKLDNISSNGAGDDWISGLVITEHSPKNQTIDYTAGTYLINGDVHTIASGGNYSLATHYSSMTSYQHRFILIYADSSNTVKSLAGAIVNKNDVPPLPMPLSDTVSLAMVEIKVNISSIPRNIENKYITDVRNKNHISTDEFIKVSADDTSTGYLFDKLSNGGNVSFSIINPGGIEQVTASVNIAGDSAVAANTAKVTNATHTGEVTGSSALTVSSTVISNKPLVSPVSGMEVLVNDAGTLKKVDAINFMDSNNFGANFQTAKDITARTSSASTFVQAQRLTTPSLPSGTYRIEIFTLHNTATSAATVGVRVQVNDTVTLFNGEEFAVESTDAATSQREHYNGADYYTGSGVLNIDIDYRVQAGSATAKIFYSSITIHRVS